MKPAAFDYFVPTSLEEALTLLASYGTDAKILAGGQSLVPAMNFRLAQPAVLIDINRVSELNYIRTDEAGNLRIGALTRQRAVERSREVAHAAPLLHETMPFIAHVQIRNRGTIGGSLAHADPAAELPAVAVTAEATFELQNQNGARRIGAEDFYLALFTTALAPDEILTEIQIPTLPERTGWAVQEVSRRRGDYAMAGATAMLSLDERGFCQRVKITYLSVGDGPVSAAKAEAYLSGQLPTVETICAAAEIAAADDVDPVSDIHASSRYRRHLVKVLTKAVLNAALKRVRESSSG